MPDLGVSHDLCLIGRRNFCLFIVGNDSFVLFLLYLGTPSLGGIKSSRKSVEFFYAVLYDDEVR